MRYAADQPWLSGELIYFNPVANAAAGTQRIRLELDNPTHMRSGLQVEVKLGKSGLAAAGAVSYRRFVVGPDFGEVSRVASRAGLNDCVSRKLWVLSKEQVSLWHPVRLKKIAESSQRRKRSSPAWAAAAPNW